MKPFFLDSMVFIAALTSEDEFKEDALKILGRLEAKEACAKASVISLMECAFVLKKYKVSEPKIKDAVNAILSINNLEFTPLHVSTLEKAFDYVTQYRLKLSDAVIVASMIEEDIQNIITEDKDFKKIEFINTIPLKKAPSK